MGRPTQLGETDEARNYMGDVVGAASAGTIAHSVQFVYSWE
jgi:hypothetical protein